MDINHFSTFEFVERTSFSELAKENRGLVVHSRINRAVRPKKIVRTKD